MAIDRFGVPHSGIEPGELDQEQHDAVRDVFFVSSTVHARARRPLRASSAASTPTTFPGAEDLDLCWRARIAGARVLVVPGRARAAPPGRHDARRRRGRLAGRRAAQPAAGAARSRRRGWSLAYLVPIALVLAVVEVDRVRRHAPARSRPSALIGAWTWNLRNLGELRKSRARRAGAAPRARRRPPLAAGAGQRPASAGYVAGSLQAEDRMRTLSERSRDRPPATPRAGCASPRRDRRARASSSSSSSGPRSLIFGRVAGHRPAARLARRRRPARDVHVGVAVLGPRLGGAGARAARRVLGARHASLLGATGLGAARSSSSARSRSACSAPGGSAAASPGRAARRSSPRSRTASTRCRATPSPTGASARSCCTRSTPFIVVGLLRVGGYLPDAAPTALVARGDRDRRARRARRPRRGRRAFAAPALRRARARARAADRAAAPASCAALWSAARSSVTGIGFVLLLPWPLAYLRAGDRLAALGFAFRLDLDFSQVLRFQTGPNGAGLSGWVIAGAALLVLVLASGPAPGLGDPGLGARAGVVRLRVDPVPASSPTPRCPRSRGCSSRPRSASRSRSGSASPRSSRTSASFHFGWRQVAAVGGAIALVVPGPSRSRSTRSTAAGTCPRPTGTRTCRG